MKIAYYHPVIIKPSWRRLYIKALLNNETQDFDKIKTELRTYESAKKFFDPAQSAWAPEKDFELCLSLDRFSFVLGVETDDNGQKVLVRHDVALSK